MDDNEDIFATTSYGKAALKKLGPVPANFRLYSAGWRGKKPSDWKEMEVKGREFRAAKGSTKLDIPVPGTIRSVIVSKEEMAAEAVALAPSTT
ncbi:hypothetical protein ABIC83_002732 [Roseateles asaccharophilus]|uniref:hypothetical protein n=1 Tax=Roseateles asaccharophilus TaxID=582607 RepID=UPI0038368BAF